MGWRYRLELRTSDLGHRKKQISHCVRNDIACLAGTETSHNHLQRAVNLTTQAGISRLFRTQSLSIGALTTVLSRQKMI